MPLGVQLAQRNRLAVRQPRVELLRRRCSCRRIRLRLSLRLSPRRSWIGVTLGSAREWLHGRLRRSYSKARVSN